MKIELRNGGKRFNREWIFRKASLSFAPGRAYAVTGANGSGKSTLLQCLAGMVQLSEGALAYEADGQPFPPEKAYTRLSFCAPYSEVIEEMTLLEFLGFHARFKPLLPGLTPAEIIAILGLEAAAGKQIRYYSSGMKQRVKLAQAIFSATPALFLDEPCSNLDEKGILLYHSLIETYGAGRLIIVCSNDPVEYRFASEVISIIDYK